MQSAASPPPEAPVEEEAVPEAPEKAAPEAPAGDDKFAQLKELKELLDAGILTEEEFAAEKAKILGD